MDVYVRLSVHEFRLPIHYKRTLEINDWLKRKAQASYEQRRGLHLSLFKSEFPDRSHVTSTNQSAVESVYVLIYYITHYPSNIMVGEIIKVSLIKHHSHTAGLLNNHLLSLSRRQLTSASS
jgi:hypothetical protein